MQNEKLDTREPAKVEEDQDIDIIIEDLGAIGDDQAQVLFYRSTTTSCTTC